MTNKQRIMRRVKMVAIGTMTEIPKTCEECRLKQATVTLYGYMLIRCCAAGFPVEDLKIRHPACPLVEVEDDGD